MVDKIVPTDRLATLEDPDGNRDNGSFDSCLHSATREGTGADCRLKIFKSQIANRQFAIVTPTAPLPEWKSPDPLDRPSCSAARGTHPSGRLPASSCNARRP